MSDVSLSNWSFGGEPASGRSHFHDTALREARIATEYHEREHEHEAAPAQPGFLARLRLAFAGPAAAPDACNCPA
jgi:hypothetical protein